MSHTAEVPDLDFLDLLDAPDDFAGKGQYVVVVTPGEDGLDFEQYVPASQILDKPIAGGAPSAGQILVFNAISNQWEAVDNNPGTTVSHFDLVAGSIGVNTHAQIDTHLASVANPHAVTATQVGKDTAQWNADEIQDFPVSETDPVEGQFLRLQSGVWVPYTLVVGAEHSCKAHLTSDETITKQTWTALIFGDTVWDTESYWSGSNPTRLTIPTGGTGRYSIRGNCIWETVTQDCSTQSRLYKNGVAVPASHAGQYINKAAGNQWLPTNNAMLFDIDLDAGDYIEFFVWIDLSTGSSLDSLGDSDPLYSSWLSLERIE